MTAKRKTTSQKGRSQKSRALKGPRKGGLKEAIRKVADAMDGPLPEEEFFAKVLELYPSPAKDPHASIRNSVRYGKVDLLYFGDVGDKQVLPIRLALRGVRFRAPVTDDEARRGLLAIDFAFPGYFPRTLDLSAWQFFDQDQQPLAWKYGQYRNILCLALPDWFAQTNFAPGDSVIVTILDWEKGHYQIEREASADRNERKIVAANQQLMDILYELLESSTYEHVDIEVAIPTAYARLGQQPYPGDCWLLAMLKDGRMAWKGPSIIYADQDIMPLIRQQTRHWFEAGFVSEAPEEHEALGEEVDPEALQLIYYFKVSGYRRPNIWRRFALRGKDTLADFDFLIRDEFDLSTFDHLSEFTKRTPRKGTQRRYRDQELQTIYPFEPGESEAFPIAQLNLMPEEHIKYTYDFGSPTELRIELEAVGEPQEGKDYPHVYERSDARYH